MFASWRSCAMSLLFLTAGERRAVRLGGLGAGSGTLRVRFSVCVPNDPPIDRAFSWVWPLRVLKVLVKPTGRTVVAAVSYSVARDLAVNECDTIGDVKIDDPGI
jgi:hypothetical protein